MILFDSLFGLSNSTGSSPLVWGYLDPGSGSMLLQILFAGVLSSLFFLKSWFRHLKASLSMKNDKA